MITKNNSKYGKSDLPVFKFLAKKLDDCNKVCKEMNFCKNDQEERNSHVAKMVRFYEDMCRSGDNLKQNYVATRLYKECEYKQLSNVMNLPVAKNQDEKSKISQKTEKNSFQIIDTGENITAEDTPKCNQNDEENFQIITDTSQKQYLLENTANFVNLKFCRPWINMMDHRILLQIKLLK